jgi:hypothetical protein
MLLFMPFQNLPIVSPLHDIQNYQQRRETSFLKKETRNQKKINEKRKGKTSNFC